MSQIITKNQVDISQLIHLIETSGKSEKTKRDYIDAITRAVNNNVDLTNAESLRLYGETLSDAQKRMFKAAYGVARKQTELILKDNARGDNVDDTQALLWNLEALGQAIKTKRSKKRKKYRWLSLEEIFKLFQVATHPRDKAILILCLGLGLRRETACKAKWEHIIIEDNKPILFIPDDKGGKSHSIGIKQSMYDSLMEYKQLTDGEGYILRSIDRWGNIKPNRLDASNVYRTVKRLAKKIGINTISPHSLRRSFAEALRKNKVDITIISKALNHASVETTMLYLDINSRDTRDLSDMIPFA